MSSYPKRVKEFVPWSKAMVQGAKVDNPSYPGTKTRLGKMMAKRRRRRKRKKVKNGKKE